MAQRRTLMMPWKIMRWVDSPLNNADLNRSLPQGGTLAADDQGRRVYFTTEWYLRYYADNHPTETLRLATCWIAIMGFTARMTKRYIPFSLYLFS